MDLVSIWIKSCRTIANLYLDGMYANFAGRDASRGMAKQSFDEGVLTSFGKNDRTDNSSIGTSWDYRDTHTY